MRVGRIKKSTRDKLPKNLGIPKFFSPSDVDRLVAERKADPHITWQQAFDRVVFNSIPDIRALVNQ